MPKITDRFGRPVSGQMPGVVQAIVVDNVDPDKMGRIKVKFPVQTGDRPIEAWWARLVMPMAGRERGWMTIPEIGDEVLIAFMSGDINHAICLGSLYNGVDTPPYANEDGNDNLRVFQSRSGHRLTFDDTPGAERAELILFNEEIKVIWDSTAMVMTVYCGGDINIEVAKTLTMNTTDFILEALGTCNIEAGATIDVVSGAQHTHNTPANMTLQAPAKISFNE